MSVLLESQAMAYKMPQAGSVTYKPLQLTPEEVETLQTFVWSGCTDSELRFGLSVCQSLGLNPLLKHVIFLKSTQGVGNLYTTRDGLLHMAHQSGQFNGMQSGVQYAHNKDGEILKINNRKVIEGAWCKVYRKDMQYPFEVEVNFEEYNRPNAQVWRQYPAAMIKKVAEHMALKLAFNVSGLASVDEIGIEEKQLQDAKLSQANLSRMKQEEAEAQASLKALLDTIRQLQQEHQLSKEEIQQITERETLRGLGIPELEAVVLKLTEYCKQGSCQTQLEVQALADEPVEETEASVEVTSKSKKREKAGNNCNNPVPVLRRSPAFRVKSLAPSGENKEQ